MELDFNKRKAIKMGIASIAVATTVILVRDDKFIANSEKQQNPLKNDLAANNEILLKTEVRPVPIHIESESAVKDNLNKTVNFDNTFLEDIFLPQEKIKVFQSALKRIMRVQKTIGYANFNLVSFDNMILYAHRFPKIGKFTKAEIELIDELFFFDANEYGFYGSKVIQNLTSEINKKETIKISGSGHYLFQGDALNKFNQLKKDVGPDLVLTSGVRSVVKQLQLFLAKLDSSNGNLSMASRSLAPPGHSYHGIGDFDVGKKGFGKFNFTSKFASTDEYKKLIELKYVDLRYTQDNQVGVRYEPWHIKVV